jgi:membrane protease YdiL (CAAX protease family)
MGDSAEHVPLRRRAERYWVESRRPLASLAFIAPLLVIYEVGVLLLGPQNGAEQFMRRVLNLLGFGQHLLLPLLTICILLGWQYLSRQPWQLSGGVIWAMAVESLGLGVCLWVISFLQRAIVPLGIWASVKHGLQQPVQALGAGIYEELLFRLILFSLLALALRWAKTRPPWGMILAAVLSSLVFAAAHHVGPSGDEWKLGLFVARFLAGMFFSIVYVYRGFGIAAGSHAAYNLLVAVGRVVGG